MSYSRIRGVGEQCAPELLQAEVFSAELLQAELLAIYAEGERR